MVWAQPGIAAPDHSSLTSSGPALHLHCLGRSATSANQPNLAPAEAELVSKELKFDPSASQRLSSKADGNRKRAQMKARKSMLVGTGLVLLPIVFAIAQH